MSCSAESTIFESELLVHTKIATKYIYLRKARNSRRLRREKTTSGVVGLAQEGAQILKAWKTTGQVLYIQQYWSITPVQVQWLKLPIWKVADRGF